MKLQIDHEWLSQIKSGDIVCRMLAGEIPMLLKVDKVTDQRICAGWEFLKANGCEVDDEIGWDGLSSTGSFIRPPTQQELRNAITKEKMYE